MPTLPRPPSGAGENTGQPGFAERLLEAALGPMAEDASQPMPGVVPAPVADKAIGLAMPAVTGMAAPVAAPTTDLPASETAIPMVETQAEIALRMRAPEGASQQISGSPPAPEPSGEVPPPTSPDNDIVAPASDEVPDGPREGIPTADAAEAVPADDAAPLPQALPPAVAEPPARASARAAGRARAAETTPARAEPAEMPPPANPAPVAAMAAPPAASPAANTAAAPQTAPTQTGPLRATARAAATAETAASAPQQQTVAPASVAAAQVAPVGPDPALPPALADGPPLAALTEGPSVAASGATAPAPAPMVPNPVARIDRAEWPQDIAMTVAESLPEGGTMVIELAPEELGRLRIVLTLEGDRASVQFQTETDAAARLLSQQERALAVELARNGMNLAGHDAQTGGGWSAPRGTATRSGAATGGDGGPDAPPSPPLHRGIVNLIA